MTAPTILCSTCSAPIPVGALYCLACGASSPTEIADTVQSSRSDTPRLSIDISARKVEVQAALGSDLAVRGLLGRGGFGEVWAALDVQLGRQVAVKVLRPELYAAPAFRERFQKEARAIARLRHPGIVPIYHVGESGGLLYFTMPLVEGITLKGLLKQPGALTADEAVRILIEATTALQEAHASGIIHRDLKPENIMLEGPQRRVLLMDFGVAKMDEAGHEDLTDTDMVLGSPEYMSPEQATGRHLDARSDIYSLGVVAYRMLAGRLPFDADTPREVLAHHVLSPPDPIGRYVELPGVLADAVMRCLAKSPDQRWASAEALLAALRRRSLPAVPPPAEPGPAPRPRRRALLVALVLTLLIGAGLLLPWLAQPAPPEDGIAATPTTASQLFALSPSVAEGCRLRTSGDTTELTDAAPRDNCWWQAVPTRELRSPLNYFVNFRVTREAGTSAGLGLAWCRSDADCRVVFIWPASRMVWGAHRPHSGLSPLDLGARTSLAAGDHHLLVRYKDAQLQVWFDGEQVLSRPLAQDSLYLERPGSFHVVVQNTDVMLTGSSAIGAAGMRP